MDIRLTWTLGAVARAARVRAALTQADVAERLGIATDVYGRLERGHMLPSVQTLRKLSLTLAVSADTLLDLGTAAASEATPPGFEENPDVRRLVRRAIELPRRKLRLLNVLARMLG